MWWKCFILPLCDCKWNAGCQEFQEMLTSICYTLRRQPYEMKNWRWSRMCLMSLRWSTKRSIMLDDYLYKALETLELTWDSLITLFLFQKNNLDCSIIAPAVQAYITELTKYRNDELHSTRKTFRQRFVEDTGSQGENGQSERPRGLCFKSHIFVKRGAYTPRESF